MGVPIGRRGERLVPLKFSEMSFRGRGERSKTDGPVVASDTGKDVSAGPEFRLDIGRGEKEINNSRFLLLLCRPWGSGRSIWCKHARYLQVMGHQEFT